MNARRKRRQPALVRGAAVAEINITPMVDVLLCLLILVMVIQPGLLKGLDLQVPLPEANAAPAAGRRDQIILHVAPGPEYALNQLAVPRDQLEQRIREVFRDRPRKVLFIKAGETVPYADVIDAVDRARGAGIRVVGLVPREPPAPPPVEGQAEFPRPGH